ncbi:DUF6236 family protein [Streptomyces sp. H10-C2]|uniref:DUF6236 family protein n=1 Tax=unclassified Streptomyces TaxID=2593676 RepID=UPI0024B9FC19|nr:MULTISPECIES: DUF6236 family protein [unclassified Streptomyces]MDJ0346419.1 DUF6236 family protein [Streptomyces sp. PH10-H1]MDJ0374805.1 DUF6236 family protein [Streptomyces sp. H10-C2]
MAIMAVRCVLPANLETVSADKIIELRTRYRDEFDAFTQAVAATAATLQQGVAGIEDRDAFEHYLRLAWETDFEEPLKNLRKAMRGLNIKAVTSSLNMKFEVGGLAALGLGHFAGQVPVTVAGASLATFMLRQATAQARDAQIKDSPVGFLLRAERHLSPATLAQQVARSITRAAGTGI